MGKVTLTSIQTDFLALVTSSPYLVKTFYLTGGTALAVFYLDHRLSEDIDLFSENPYDQDFVRGWMAEQKKLHSWKLTYAQVFERQTYEIIWKESSLKIEFVHYPHKQIAASAMNHNGLMVDSIEDIAANKLLTITQRNQTKDYVDLYFLLKRFTFWDLMHGATGKFGVELEPFYLSSILPQVEKLTALPVMKKKLTLPQLKKYFLSEAKRLGRRFVKS
jgi:hypothetical protein